MDLFCIYIYVLKRFKNDDLKIKQKLNAKCFIKNEKKSTFIVRKITLHFSNK